MKSLKLFIFLLVFSSPGFGQKKFNALMESLFEKANELYEDSSYDQAVQVYEKIINLADPGSTESGKAMFNSGYVYLLQGKIKQAKKTFLDILDEDLNEMDRGGRGSGLMGEPYALYKHNSCEALADMELNAGNFESALEYIELFDKVYPYHHFCGNEWAAYDIFKADMYAKTYCGLKDTTEALQKLLPNIFNSGLASNEALVKYTISILLQQYERSFLINSFKDAVANMSVKTIGKGRNERKDYGINFLNVWVSVPSSFSDRSEVKAGTTELERRKLAALSDDFFKTLSK